MATWTEIRSDNVAALEQIANLLKIHPLVIEDAIHRDQRPKLEDYETHQFLVWFMLASQELYELQFIVLQDHVIMIPHDPPPEGETWQKFLRLNTEGKDALHILYQALDRATDVSWKEVRQLSRSIDEFEEKIFYQESNPQTILEFKKVLHQVNYSMGHLPSVVKQIQHFFHPADDLKWKLRDLQDHCGRIYDQISSSLAQIASTIELYWGFQADKTNRQVKKLSLLVSITVPLTVWTSFWGMNFESIPFKSETLFLSAIAMMVLSVGVTVWFLVKRGYWSK